MYLGLAFLLVIWFETLRRRGGFSSSLPLSYRIQNICLSFLLVFPNTVVLFGFWWRVLHPTFLADYFYVQSGAFPPFATLLTVALSVCASHVALRIGFLLAKQKKKGRILAVVATPYILGIQIIDSVRMFTSYEQKVDLLLVVFSSAFFVCLLLWLYRFSKNEQTALLMNDVT